MKKRNKQLLITLAAFTVLMAAGCSSKSSSPADYQSTITETMAAAETIAAAAEEAKSTNDSLSGNGGTLSISNQSAVAGRKLIRTVTMSAETENFDTLLSSVQSSITSLGGYIEESHISGISLNIQSEEMARYASIIARIPSGNLDGFVKTVESGSNVTSKNEATSDVTLDYSDTESRKKSLAVEQDRLWALLEKADSLESVIVLEQRLSEIRYELEAMESKLRLYDNQVEYSTVNLDISEVKEYTPIEPVSSWTQIQKGFTKNARGLVDFLSGIFINLIISLPVWLPIVLLILIVGTIALKYAKKHAPEQFPPQIKDPAKEAMEQKKQEEEKEK